MEEREDGGKEDGERAARVGRMVREKGAIWETLRFFVGFPLKYFNKPL